MYETFRSMHDEAEIRFSFDRCPIYSRRPHKYKL